MRKNKMLMPVLAGFAALLALCCACAHAETAFLFRNGITWDTTVEQLLAAEGVADSGAYVHGDTGVYETFMVEAEGGTARQPRAGDSACHGL